MNNLQLTKYHVRPQVCKEENKLLIDFSLSKMCNETNSLSGLLIVHFRLGRRNHDSSDQFDKLQSCTKTKVVSGTCDNCFPMY